MPGGYLTTFTAGHVGFQVMGWELNGPIPLRRPHLSLPRPMTMAFHQLWPIAGRRSFRWPWTVEGAKVGAEDAVACVAGEWEAMEVLASWPQYHPGILNASISRVAASR